jgi:hypothetical protein
MMMHLLSRFRTSRTNYNATNRTSVWITLLALACGLGALSVRDTRRVRHRLKQVGRR